MLDHRFSFFVSCKLNFSLILIASSVSSVSSGCSGRKLPLWNRWKSRRVRWKHSRPGNLEGVVVMTIMKACWKDNPSPDHSKVCRTFSPRSIWTVPMRSICRKSRRGAHMCSFDLWVPSSWRKFRSQASDNMDRWKSSGGKSQRREEKKRDQTRETVRRKKMQVREKAEKSRITVCFPMSCGRWKIASRCSAKRISKSQVFKTDMHGTLSDVQTSFCFAVARSAHLVKSEQVVGYCSSFKKDGRRGGIWKGSAKAKHKRHVQQRG